jgi:hypothetical protein
VSIFSKILKLLSCLVLYTPGAGRMCPRAAPPPPTPPHPPVTPIHAPRGLGESPSGCGTRITRVRFSTKSKQQQPPPPLSSPPTTSHRKGGAYINMPRSLHCLHYFRCCCSRLAGRGPSALALTSLYLIRTYAQLYTLLPTTRSTPSPLSRTHTPIHPLTHHSTTSRALAYLSRPAHPQHTPLTHLTPLPHTSKQLYFILSIPSVGQRDISVPWKSSRNTFFGGPSLKPWDLAPEAVSGSLGLTPPRPNWVLQPPEAHCW